MESCLYKCEVMHYRNEKIKRFFKYNYFMFLIDLDEIEKISENIFMFNHNKRNIYNLKDQDYYIFDKPGIKQNISKYLRYQGLNPEELKIKLLTNVSTFGYNFNPVSFYYCFDKNNNPVCVVPEVGNTFNELKLFYINSKNLTNNIFIDRQKKNFYVSPFLDHDNTFEFRLKVPEEKLFINISDFKNGKKVFSASLKGEKINLTNFKLFKMTLLFPLVTLKVIGAIHWQALILLIKKINYFKKNEYPEKQKGMVLKWQKR